MVAGRICVLCWPEGALAAAAAAAAAYIGHSLARWDIVHLSSRVLSASTNTLIEMLRHIPLMLLLLMLMLSLGRTATAVNLFATGKTPSINICSAAGLTKMRTFCYSREM